MTYFRENGAFVICLCGYDEMPSFDNFCNTKKFCNDCLMYEMSDKRSWVKSQEGKITSGTFILLSDEEEI